MKVSGIEIGRQQQSEAHGIIYFRKRRGRKIHFMIAGPTFSEARNYIAWDRVERNTQGETTYQYFWTGGSETKEITQ